MKLSRVYKGIFLSILLLVLMLCFTFNAFAIDMPSKSQDPQITIDGFDMEASWLEGSRETFTDFSGVVGMASVEMLNYKNSVYGMVNFTDVADADSEFIVRIDFHYKKYNTYIIFLMKNQRVLLGDGDLSVDGALNETKTGYCAEFSFWLANNLFAYGDLVQIEISYGNIGETDDYESVYGFADKKSFEYYIGSKLPESSGSIKPNSSSGNNSGSNSTKTTKSSKDNAVTAPTNYNVEQFKDYGYTDAMETTVIFSVMAAACVVLVVITLSIRKHNGNKKFNYTDDDKGCD